MQTVKLYKNILIISTSSGASLESCIHREPFGSVARGQNSDQAHRMTVLQCDETEVLGGHVAMTTNPALQSCRHSPEGKLRKRVNMQSLHGDEIRYVQSFAIHRFSRHDDDVKLH
ncbi:hypothetical protein BaRGS_00023884 [Batillaria attramentaria]|uniref:Uncharacterized protein n=1 Tax=Batillaria attramentaria TaxID=370345 RepID=A0ABD0KCF4_9CAEN